MTQDIKLLPCPFCGGLPEIQPWHGGAPTKVLIGCSNSGFDDDDGGCSVGPMVTGETPDEAQRRWNRRTTEERYRLFEDPFNVQGSGPGPIEPREG